MTPITDRKTGKKSEICRTYRVQSGAARLYVGRDRTVWYGEPDAERYSLVGRIPEGQPITKDAACRAANCS